MQCELDIAQALQRRAKIDVARYVSRADEIRQRRVCYVRPAQARTHPVCR